MKKSAHGFTLVELLVVIAIIAILAAVVVLIINPLELTRRGRDAARLTDLSNLQQAINVELQEATDSADTILCYGSTAPATCTGSSNLIVSRVPDGTGWVKVNLSSKSVSVPTLPIDPSNNDANHYTYCSDGSGWKIVTKLESLQQSPKMGTDGGSDIALYEVGSSLSLACTY